MKQSDMDDLTRIANEMDKALIEFRGAIKVMDRIVDQSPVRDKGQPMNREEIEGLAVVTAGMRRTISFGLTAWIESAERIIGRNLNEASRP